MLDNKVKINDEGVLFSQKYDEGYFSAYDGVGESRCVFLQANNLEQRFVGANHFSVGELGFGTGRNFLLTADLFLRQNKKGVLYYISCEKYLLSSQMIDLALTNIAVDKKILKELLQKLPKQKVGFHLLNLAGGRIKLLLLLGEAERQLKNLQGKVQAWFLDGFSPKKNPDMWEEQIFSSLARLSTSETTFSSYTASSAVRNRLAKAGFEVVREKGFGYKRHKIRGKFRGYVKPSLITYPYFSFLPCEVKSPRIAIIGAGLAGTSIARVLSSFDCKLDIYDKDIALGASGNQYGIAIPIISKKEDIYAEFTLSGLSCLNSWLEKEDIISKQVLEFATNEQREKRLEQGARRYKKDFVAFYKATSYCEFEQNYCYLQHFDGCVISPKKLCRKNLARSKAQVNFGSFVKEIKRDNDKWLVSNQSTIKKYDVVILANAVAIKDFSFSQEIGVRPVRGQLITLPLEQFNIKPKSTLNYMDYLIPHSQGVDLGATFDVDNTSLEFLESDGKKLLDKLNKTFPNLLKKQIQNYTGRVAQRAVTADYFPLVGAVADKQYYYKTYNNLRHGLPDKNYPLARYHPNLYCAVGYGARGLLSSFLCAEVLASQIFGLPIPIPAKQLRMFHTSRFWIRELKRKKS